MAPGDLGEAVLFLVFQLKIAWNQPFVFPAVCLAFQTEARATTTRAGIRSLGEPRIEASEGFMVLRQLMQELFPR